MYEHVVPPLRTFARELQIDLNLRRERILAEIFIGAENRRDLWMVAQILSNPRRVEHQRNSHLVDMVGRTDTGEHEDLRRADRARGQYDLVGIDIKQFPTRFDRCSYRLIAVEQQLMNMAVASESEIQTMA